MGKKVTHLVMRSHQDIIRDGGGATKVSRDIGVLMPAEQAKLLERTKAWLRGNSIPAEYWPVIVQLDLATLDELAVAAEARKFPDLAAERRAGAQEGAAA